MTVPARRVDGQFLSKPDFLIFGWQMEGLFYVLGSTDMPQASVEMVADIEEFAYDYAVASRVVGSRHYITAEMRHFTIGVGTTYAEAMRNLFNAWSPDADAENRHPLMPQMLALEAGQ